MCLAIPGKVIEILDDERRLASVDVAGVRRKIDVALLDDGASRAKPGDWVLIHVGFAISRIDEDEARATLALLRETGPEFDREVEEIRSSRIE
jgi:hydrogenase expression/formation protein HypC